MHNGEIRLGENVSIVQCSDSRLVHFCRLLRLQNVSLLITSSHFFFFFPPLQLHSSLLDPTSPLPQAPLSLFLLPLGLTAKIKCWKSTTNSRELDEFTEAGFCLSAKRVRVKSAQKGKLPHPSWVPLLCSTQKHRVPLWEVFPGRRDYA